MFQYVFNTPTVLENVSMCANDMLTHTNDMLTMYANDILTLR